METSAHRETWTQEGDVAVNGTTLHFRRGGLERATPLLLLHGITDDGGCWPRVSEDLAGRYDVIATDARGHGRSGDITGGFSVDILADDAAALLEHLSAVPALVWGHSMGAITAISLAARHPDSVRAAVLEDPPLWEGPGPEDPEAEDRLRELQRTPREERIEQGLQEHPAWGANTVLPWAEAQERVRPEVMAHLHDLRSYPWREALQRTRCPLLLLTGEPALGAIVGRAAARDAERLASHLRVVRIPGAGHCIHRDRYREALLPVQDFLRENAC